MWKSCSKSSIWKSGGQYAVNTNSHKKWIPASAKINTTISHKKGSNNKMSLQTRITTKIWTKRIKWRTRFEVKPKMTLRMLTRKLSAKTLQTTSPKIVPNQISYIRLSVRNSIPKNMKIIFASSWELWSSSTGKTICWWISCRTIRVSKYSNHS